jgi:hypothetical protein
MQVKDGGVNTPKLHDKEGNDGKYPGAHTVEHV